MSTSDEWPSPPLDRSLLTHPDTPRNSTSFLIRQRAACRLEGQLDLAVVVALVPDHVLKQEDRVVVVDLHVMGCFHPALDRVADRLGAVVQHLREAIGVALVHPLLLGQVSGELGRILGDEHQPHIVYVRKSSATDGLPPITRASSPPSGRARSRLSRIVLFRSQESSRASSRPSSRVLDIMLRARLLARSEATPPRRRRPRWLARRAHRPVRDVRR